MWSGLDTVTAGATNVTHAIPLAAVGTVQPGADGLLFETPPSRLFVRVVPRLPVSDLRDSDGDGAPDIYEFHNDTNPWVKDYACVRRTTLDSVTNLQAVLDRVPPYSIIELAAGEYELYDSVHLPTNPVMLTAASPGAVIRSAATPGVVMFDRGQTSLTLIENFRIWLDARNGFQAAFWCGGDLPWSGVGASGTFRNVHIRMPYPGVEYFGWHFYRWRGEDANIFGCSVNASGSTWANGVYGYDPPGFVIRNSSFLNFPTNRLSTKACAICLTSSQDNHGCVTGTVPVHIANCAYDDSFTNALALARIERGAGFFVTLEKSIVPAGFVQGHAPDVCEGLWTTNAGLAWCGFPTPGSPADRQGVGAYAVLRDGTTDSDGDGDSDYDETYLHGTDPWFSDTDGDRVPDPIEREEGTDPLDVSSFLRYISVVVTNRFEVSNRTNFVCWSSSPDAWMDPLGAVAFVGRRFVTEYEGISAPGTLYVKTFLDLDCDGVYSPGHDPFLIREIGCDHAVHKVTLTFGDVDGDGVPDRDEYDAGTDPNDERNYRLDVHVEVVNDDVRSGVTNYVAVLAPGMGWDVSCVVTSFVNYSVSLQVNREVVEGSLNVSVLRDLNGNGVFDMGTDVVVSRTLTAWPNGNDAVLRVGDVDGDGVPDYDEYLERTNPNSRMDYCFNLRATCNGIFSPSNGLKAVAYLGAWTNVLYGPVVVSERNLTMDLGHLVTTSGEKAGVLFWEDLDGDGVWSEGERRTVCTFNVDVHDMWMTNSVPLGDFDADSDGMLDDWEVLYGLDPGNSADATQDKDSDGFINLYEFRAGTCPTNALENGEGTLLRAISESVDNRIVGKDPESVKLYYLGYGAEARNRFETLSDVHFACNTNCWIHDVDLSFLSVWNDDVANGYDWTHPMTVISPRHVMTATHVVPTNGTRFVFQTPLGETVVRRLVSQCAIRGIASDDWLIGLLDEPLPESIHPVRFLPQNYADYIGNGRKLPILRIGRDKGCYIQDALYLAPNQMELRMSKVEYSTDSWRKKYSRGPVAYDSGNPIFLLQGNEVLYLCPTRGFYYDDYQASGYMCATRLRLIQDVMDSLCHEAGVELERLRTYDLSTFPKLPFTGGPQ